MDDSTPNSGFPEGKPPEPTPTPGGPVRFPVRTAVLFYGVLFGVGWGASALAGNPLMFASLDAAERGVDFLRDTGLGLIAAALVILLSDQFTKMTAAGESLARALGALLGSLSIVQCVWLAFLSGVAEEALFRGALQPHVGLVTASLLFGLAHFVPRRDLWPWSLFAVAVGALLGTLFDATGNLIAPTVAHVGINAVNLRLLSKRYGSPDGARPSA